MVVFQLTLLILFGLSIATMFSGFMLARRMGMYLMMQVMMLMLAMFVSLIALVLGVFLPEIELLYWVIAADFVLYLLAALMEFVQVVPILMKTMQGGPIHSSHITNILLALFLTLGLVLYYAPLASL